MNIAAIRELEARQGIAEEFRSFELVHKRPAAHTVLMLHGYTASPRQFNELAHLFYDQGYNVYVPLLPNHGTGDFHDVGALTQSELVEAGERALAHAASLGETVGIVGISAGANLGTWLAIHGAMPVERIVLISPFYEPSRQRVSATLLRVAQFVYGRRLLPNKYSGKFSYYTIAQLVTMAKHYKRQAHVSQLKNVGLVMGSHDTDINQHVAHTIARSLAQPAVVQVHVTNPKWKLGHDIVTADHPHQRGKKSELYQLYLEFYA